MVSLCDHLVNGIGGAYSIPTILISLKGNQKFFLLLDRFSVSPSNVNIINNVTHQCCIPITPSWSCLKWPSALGVNYSYFDCNHVASTKQIY